MSGSTDWQFAVEIHPPEWRFAVGPSWLAGWIFGGEGRLVTDLRGWIDDRPCLGIHGMPRPGLDEKFLTRPGPPYCGFVLLLQPHRGAKLLRLEVRDAAGRWTEFFRTHIVAADDAPARVAPAPVSVHLDVWIADLLRLRAQRPAEQSFAALADELVSGALAEPLNSLPNPPFHGALEAPLTVGKIRYGRLSVTGWLAHRTGKIVQLTALTDAVQESVLSLGMPRTGVDAIFADLPGHRLSQFAGLVDLPPNQSAPVLLKIFAELDDGTKHLVFAQRFTPRVVAGAGAPMPPFSRLTFARTAWALLRSARRHGLGFGDMVAARRALTAAWRTFAAEAPLVTPRVAALRHAVTPPAKPLGVLIVTHNLNPEGAPWFILEYARHLAAQPGWRVRVISPEDGPLREKFAATGLAVEVIDVRAVLAAQTMPEFETAVAQLAATVDWSGVDLVVANTMVSFWAVHLARLARRPALFYIHESAPIRQFFSTLLTPALVPAVEAAFGAARRVVFIAAASRAVFSRLERATNFRSLPSWIDVAGIRQFSATHDPAALRDRHGFPRAAVIFANIGSVCERKGQRVFIRAVAALQARFAAAHHPAPSMRFLMVGARPSLYLDELRHDIAHLGLSDIVIIDEVPGTYDYYRLADIFVCSSFEESFPRVLLEAAAFALPIVSTNVNGIPEMLAPDDAWLVPPGDALALAGAMEQALHAHLAGDRARAQRAHASVTARFAAARSLPLHRAMANEAAAP